MMRWTLPGFVAVVAVTVAGCSSSGGGPNMPKSDLAAALTRVTDTAANRAYVQFGRPRAAIAANGGTSLTGAYQRAIGVGADRLVRSYRSLADSTGIDPLAATYAISAGNPPGTGLLLSGLDLGDTGPRLESLGAARSTKGSASTYRFRPDNKIDLDDKLSAAVPGVLNALNVVEIDGHDVRAGASTAAIAATRASGSGLLDDAVFRDLASCLGDPLAAVLTTRAPGQGAAVRAVGVGISGAKGEIPTDQLCVRTAGASDAKALADKVRAAVRSGESRQSRVKWTELLSGADVSVAGSVVRLSAHPAKGRPAGTLFTSLLIGDLPGLA